MDGKLSEVLKRLPDNDVRSEFDDPRVVEAVTRDIVARAFFSAVRRVKLPPGARKAPLLKVAELYYIKGWTARQVARECRCSRRLIVERLQQLSRDLGRESSQLRALVHNAPETP
jgi:hypothetical protein